MVFLANILASSEMGTNSYGCTREVCKPGTLGLTPKIAVGAPDGGEWQCLWHCW